MRTTSVGLGSETLWKSVNPDVLSVGFHPAAPDWLSPPKNQVQTDFDIWYVDTGCGSVMIDDAWHAFETGDLVAVKPGHTYRRERADAQTPFRVYFMHVLPFGRDADNLNATLSAALPTRMNMLHRPACGTLFAALFEAYTTRPAHYSLAVKGLSLQLLELILEETQLTDADARGRPHPGLLRAKAFAESNYAENLTLADIAAAASLSASHVSALFADCFGVSPIEYLLRLRIRQAKLRLARGMRVKETARQVGFQSQSYFSRTFRRRVGISPRAFMLRHARP
ncbi:MAG: helix-turn-helix transcriptional regulator [Candidatus Pacebacteria bacterium]|nr:helix-turn-helix transcriptional regulator [Candidatus Paceibacterota bacterium]